MHYGKCILLLIGYGVYHYANKFYKYEGQWKNGLKHGRSVRVSILSSRGGSRILTTGVHYMHPFSDHTNLVVK